MALLALPASGFWLRVCKSALLPLFATSTGFWQMLIFYCFSRCWTGEPCQRYVIAWLPLLTRLASISTAFHVSR